MTLPRAAAHDGVIRRECPIDLRALAPVPVATAEDVAVAVARARGAQTAWRARPIDHRIAVLERAARDMLDRVDEILGLLRDEIGKLEVDGLFSEALGPLDAVRGWSRVVRRAERRTVRLDPLAFPRKRAGWELVPRGVIGVIAPWNYPLGNAFRSVIPALLTGNGVVLKPSEHSPLAGAWFAQRLAAVLPEGLISVVQGDGRVGRLLIDAGVDAVVFTGSPGPGREVQARCGALGIPCSAELGGKDAAIVLSDCDLPRTVAGITHWALHNVGQACGAVEIAYVEEGVADAFVAALRDTWTRLRVGDGPPGEVDVSPMAHRAQLDLVRRHVADAVAHGARLVCGGEPTGRGLFFQPTVLDRCDEPMAVVREESFGPVLAIVRVQGAEEAVARVNRGVYGLGASVWSRDIARAERLARRLEVGVVAVNNHSVTGAVAALPWSGTRATGSGVANSEISLATFTRPRTWLVDRARRPEPFWLPFDARLWTLGRVLVEAQLGRLRRVWQVPGLLWSRTRTVLRFFRSDASGVRDVLGRLVTEDRDAGV